MSTIARRCYKSVLKGKNVKLIKHPLNLVLVSYGYFIELEQG